VDYYKADARSLLGDRDRDFAPKMTRAVVRGLDLAVGDHDMLDRRQIQDVDDAETYLEELYEWHFNGHGEEVSSDYL